MIKRLIILLILIKRFQLLIQPFPNLDFTNFLDSTFTYLDLSFTNLYLTFNNLGIMLTNFDLTFTNLDIPFNNLTDLSKTFSVIDSTVS